MDELEARQYAHIQRLLGDLRIANETIARLKSEKAELENSQTQRELVRLRVRNLWLREALSRRIRYVKF